MIRVLLWLCGAEGSNGEGCVAESRKGMVMMVEE